MPLNEKLKRELKEKLLDEKERLEKELSRFAKPTDVPGDYETRYGEIGPGSDENASEVEEYADNLALENTLEKQLKETSEALEKMENGTYGTCSNCNQEIDIERLRAYPAAATCMKCS